MAKNQDDITHSLNAPVSDSDTKHSGQGLQGNNAPVFRQAGMGRLICEQCGKDVERKTHNQRFCCSDCRVYNWELIHGAKVLKKKAPAGS